MIVPHFFQGSPQTCGPACLRMVFAALGVSQTETAIAIACQTVQAGCTIPDLVAGAHSFGFSAAILTIGDEQQAQDALANDVPFVAMIDLASLQPSLPLFQWHFVVSLGLVNGDVLFHDPVDGPDRRVAKTDFLLAWETAGYLGVRVWTP